jgi:ankyrin repeat protein
MPSRDLPARPDLDHLKHQAKALRAAFVAGDAEALARVRAVLGDATSTIKLTDAQRVVAREYGFPTWARLRAHVQAARGGADAVNEFLAAIYNRDRARALAVLHQAPEIAERSLHVAAILGRADVVRRLIASDGAQIHAPVGEPSAAPLYWLCWSPFHGESAARDEGLLESARALLDAGVDPNATESRYGVPALYAVTGENNAPRIARLLLERGANPTDGESVFHAAERFHIEALELLREYGVDLNAVGEWGNTPLYFLLRYFDVARMPRVRQGLEWLLDHGADPNVRSARERETALHIALRVGQQPEIVRLLLDRGADARAQRGDGRSAWLLATRAGHDDLAAMLESSGAEREKLSPADALASACGRGDAEAARALASPALIASLYEEDLRILPHAASMEGRGATVLACLAAGFPVSTTDEMGATALHHAAIHGAAALVRTLLAAGADLGIRDNEHHATPLGWACFGADHVADDDGDYGAVVAALVEAGATVRKDEYVPEHPAVRAVLREHGIIE